MRRACPLLLVLTASSTAAASEPWIDPEPLPERYEIGSIGVAADGEYRANFLLVNPINVAGEDNRRASWIEQRGRFGATVDYEQKVKISASIDLLESVLWGDNGTFTGVPASDSGVNATSRDPNLTKACVTYLEGDPLRPESYGYGLCEAEPVRVRRLFAQVNTPIGALRIGRQRVTEGMSVQSATGDGRENRFGVSYEGDSVDRALFATKPLEILKPADQRDYSEHRGLIVAAAYDRLVTDSTKIFSDDLNQMAVAVRYLDEDFYIGRDLEAQVFYAHRWDSQFNTRINILGGRVIARFDRLHIGLDMAGNVGRTDEIAVAYSVISNDPIPEDGQEVLQIGGRFAARYDWPRPEQPIWTAYLELDYASGDGNPKAGSPLSQFVFSDDANVGLLMFEHVLRFQSARAALAGVEILSRLAAPSLPAERVHTRGAFTNAFAIFPQFDVRPHPTVLFRGGALIAWAPANVHDQVASLQAEDNETIEDDLVNFAGGKPGHFYGAELDGRFQWRFVDHFALDLEAAVLFPGDVFEDVNGLAVHSVMTQARTTFFF